MHLPEVDNRDGVAGGRDGGVPRRRVHRQEGEEGLKGTRILIGKK